MDKFFSLLSLLSLIYLITGTGALAESDIKKWPNQSCSDLYKAIGIFTALSHKEWQEKKNEKKGAFYASAAADYSIIYQTVCNK